LIFPVLRRTWHAENINAKAAFWSIFQMTLRPQHRQDCLRQDFQPLYAMIATSA
jgi:hypothetical protein